MPPQPVSYPWLAVLGQFRLGVNLCRQRKWAEAEKELRAAIRLERKDVFATPQPPALARGGSLYAYLGDALANQGKRAEAQAAFQKAAFLMRDAYDHFVRWGEFYAAFIEVP